MRKVLFLLSLTVILTSVHAQVKKTEAETKKVKVNALIIGNYAFSLDKNVDVQSGLHKVASDSGVVTNSLSLKYVRVQGNFEITPKIDASVLVNFAELKNANSDYRKVIENAYARYKFFKDGYLNVQIGQFRPYAQLENTYGIQFHRSYTWSNQYSALGASNWASFQLGAALTGSLKKKKIPVNYYLTMWNGNGRTVSAVNSNEQTNGDNNNSKNIALRLEVEPAKDIILGGSAATAKFLGKSITSYTADIRAKATINKWETEIEAAYATANDMSAIIGKLGTTKPASTINFSDYKMDGFYFLPVIRYNSPSKKLKSTEFSCRVERWNQLISGAKNPRTTIVPMLTFSLAENRGALLQLYGVINQYKNQVKTADSKIYNANQVAIQTQFYF